MRGDRSRLWRLFVTGRSFLVGRASRRTGHWHADVAVARAAADWFAGNSGEQNVKLKPYDRRWFSLGLKHCLVIGGHEPLISRQRLPVDGSFLRFADFFFTAPSLPITDGGGDVGPSSRSRHDAFAGYPEAVDLTFGAHARYGTITKQYLNAKIIYTPSEMIGTKRTPRKGMSKQDRWAICTSHVEPLNGTQRLILKCLNRLTYCFSKKLRNLDASFAAFVAYYNFCWRTRRPGKSGKCRPTVATMAGLTDHTWTFDELFDAVLQAKTGR